MRKRRPWPPWACQRQHAAADPVSHVWLIVLMYFGRVGPPTMMLSITARHARSQTSVRYPEEDVIIADAACVKRRTGYGG